MENKYVQEMESKNLPSKKLQYPEATKVFYSPYTLGDLHRINTSSVDFVQRYEDILSGIRTSGMDKYDLTFYDVVYLGWLRKIASFKTPLFALQSFCPNCDIKNSKTLELKDMEFEDTQIPKLPISIKIADRDISFGFLTIRGYLEILKSNKSEDIVYVFSKHIKNMAHKEAYELIDSLIGEDVDRVEYINKILYHGLAKVNFKCNSCNFEYQVNPANYAEAEITRPFRRQEHDIRNEISFG